MNKAQFDNILNKAKKDKEVVAVILFGSFARKEKNKDIDLCLVLNKKYSRLFVSKKKLEYTQIAKKSQDIQIFQQLPIYIRIRVLKEGKILLSKDDAFLYDLAFLTIKEFGFYKKIYDLYLTEIQKIK